MSASRDPYERLLRWYPRRWREAHGAVLLTTLRDADDAAGRTRPTRADAWSLRVHGTAERLTPTAGWVLATAGAAASLGLFAVVVVLLGRDEQAAASGRELLADPVDLLQLLLTAAAPALVSLGAMALLRSGRVLTDPAAVLAGALGVAAWSVAALASASWGVGFERADAGMEQTPFSAATAELFWAAAAVGALAAAVVWDAVLRLAPWLRDAPGRRGGRTVARHALALLLGGPNAVLLGLGAVLPGSALVGGACVAAACLATTRSDRLRPALPPPGPPTAGLPSDGPAPRRPRPPLAADRRRAGAAAQLAVAGLVVGSAATAHALVGVLWQDTLTDMRVPFAWKPPMNLGLVVGSFAGVLVAVALGVVVAPGRERGGRSRVRWLVTGGVVVALLLRAASAASAPDGDSGTLVLFAGGVVLGLVLAAPLARRLSGGAAVRWATAGLLGGAVGLTAGTGVLAVAPLLVPLVAAALLVALLVSAARLRRTAGGTAAAETSAPA